ncbi:MAG: metal-sensing transcriptional repressor, partial [Candidatus Limnocylindrales bacterium]
SAVAHANRAAGQAAGVAEMVRTGKPMDAIVQQLLAAQGSLDALLLRLVQQEVDRQVGLEALHPDVRRLLGPVLRRSRSPSRRARPTGRPSTPPHAIQPEGSADD